MVFYNELLINSWIFAVHPFNKTKGSKLYKVAVAFFIFCKQYLVMTRIFLFFGECFTKAICCNIKFTTYDRFYFQLPIFILVLIGFCYKFKNAKHVPMITDGQCGHTIGYRFF